MIFVQTDKLKEGMRLGKPIYNKKGVLLYERDSRLTRQAIESVKNFGLLGVFILDPAEPCPPMTEEDIEFERFQTMAIFQIEESLDTLIKKGKASRLRDFADRIISKFGRLDHKINFQQSLRGNDDYVYKHSLNVAILSAMISYRLQFHGEEQIECIMAAVVHEIGKFSIPDEVKKTLTKENSVETERKFERGGHSMIEDLFFSTPSVKRTVSQAFQLRDELEARKDISHMKLTKGARVLAACDLFDCLTAMSLTEEPLTVFGALKQVKKNEAAYGKDVTEAFIKSINFLPEGSSVELTNGEKGLIIAANDYDIFRPVVLTYHGNKMIDLRRTGREGPEILDLVKKFDARHVIDRQIITAARETIE